MDQRSPDLERHTNAPPINQTDGSSARVERWVRPGVPIDGNAPEGFNPLLKKIAGEIETGELRGVQVYVSRNGRVLLNAGLGWARETVPMRHDTITHWLCCTKSLVAVSIAQLEEEGLLDVDQPVAHYWPEFAANGKSQVTVRGLLTHTSGIVGDPAEEFLFCSTERVAESIAQCQLDSQYDGVRARYIHFSGYAALAEIVRRLTGTPIAVRVKHALFDRLDMRESHLGVPLSTFDAYGDRMSRLHITTRGGPAECSFLNWRESAGYDWPGFAARGPVFELARFYESLLGFGTPILGRATIDRFTSPWRGRLYDDNLQDDVDWGLGFKTSATFFGCQSVTGRVFGHTGLGSSFCVALPDHGVVVVWASNVISPPNVHRARIRRTMPALVGGLQLKAKTT